MLHTLNKKGCLIFSGGDFDKETFKMPSGTECILCADGGYYAAESLGLTPDGIIGDFDTFPYPEDDTNLKMIRYPAEKDDTDTMLAVKYALDSGYSRINIYGAMGKRFDHTMANLQTLCFIKSRGGSGHIYARDNEITVLSGETAFFTRREGWYLSVFSLSDRCTGVDEIGVKYPLKDAMLINTVPMGISNEIQEEVCEIRVDRGLLGVILSKKQ